jgi:hypothetical protein
MVFARCICFGEAFDSFGQLDMEMIRNEIHAELRNALGTQ